MGRLSEYATDEAAYLRGTPRLGTSADEAVQLLRATERLREAIAAKVEALGCAGRITGESCGRLEEWHDDFCPIAIAAMIREEGRKG
jgi:hypothetical protein